MIIPFTLKNVHTQLVRKIIQSVTVYEEHFVISFKSGIEIEI
jgi:site-specific DNA recombinase